MPPDPKQWKPAAYAPDGPQRPGLLQLPCPWTYSQHEPEPWPQHDAPPDVVRRYAAARSGHGESYAAHSKRTLREPGQRRQCRKAIGACGRASFIFNSRQIAGTRSGTAFLSRTSFPKESIAASTCDVNIRLPKSEKSHRQKCSSLPKPSIGSGSGSGSGPIFHCDCRGLNSNSTEQSAKGQPQLFDVLRASSVSATGPGANSSPDRIRARSG